MSNLILDQGATWVRIWTYQTALGVPIDLTGASAAFQVRRTNTEGVVVFDLDSISKGGVVLGGALGTITVTIPDAMSSALNLAGYQSDTCSENQGDGTTRTVTAFMCVWGIELTISGQVIRLDEGILGITREIVR